MNGKGDDNHQRHSFSLSVGKEMKTPLHLISKEKSNQFIKALQNFNYKHTADSKNVYKRYFF